MFSRKTICTCRHSRCTWGRTRRGACHTGYPQDHVSNDVRNDATLVVLSIAVGVVALGLVLNMRDTMHTWMPEDYRAANASHLLIRMAPFQYDLVKLFQREFEDAEIKSQVSLPEEITAMKLLRFSDANYLNPRATDVAPAPPQRRFGNSGKSCPRRCLGHPQHG